MAEEVKLTERERQLLEQIMNDKYSVGSFCGMITNLVTDLQSKQIATTPEKLIRNALKIRLIAQDMADPKTPPSVMTGQGPTLSQMKGRNDDAIATSNKKLDVDTKTSDEDKGWGS